MVPTTPQGTAPPPNARGAVERFYEAFRTGRAADAEAALDAAWVDHTLPAGRAPGRAGMVEAIARLRAALPDLTADVVVLVADGDRVAAHLRFAGTHRGSLLGEPATGRRVEFLAFDIHQVRQARVVESWHLEDNLALLRQLGVVPALGA